MKGEIFYRSIATRKEDKSAKGKENVRKIKKTRRKKNDANRSRQLHLALVSWLQRQGQLIQAGKQQAPVLVRWSISFCHRGTDSNAIFTWSLREKVGICGRAPRSPACWLGVGEAGGMGVESPREVEWVPVVCC